MNIAQILQLTPEQIARDHEQLVNLALEAQMTELQSALSSTPNNGSSPASATTAADGAKDPNAEAFNSYAVVKLLAPVANDIARGVTIGIRNTIRAELDNAMRDAFGSSVREAQKKALKRRLDEVLQKSATHFSEEVQKRLEGFTHRELRDVLSQVNASTNALVEENRRLQMSINDIVNSGMLKQLMDTKEELQKLKENLKSCSLSALAAAAGGGGDGGAGQGANPSNFAGNCSNPETMLTKARAMLVDENKPSSALEYITLARIPSLTLRLLNSLPDSSIYYNLIGDRGISDDLWVDVLTQLSSPNALENSTDAAADAHFAAELLLDVLCERDSLTTKKTAKVQAMLSGVRQFVALQKHSMTDSEGQRTLRDLEKSIQ